MEGSLSAVAALLSLDLCAVFESDEIDRRMLDLCLAMVYPSLCCTAATAWTKRVV